MGNQHWDQELPGEEGMRPLKLPPKFMEAQMNILQPLSMDCLTLQKRCKLDTLTKLVLSISHPLQMFH